MSADRDRLRQELDDSVLMHTGRSVGDIASGRVVDDIWPIVQAIAAAELRAAAEAWEKHGNSWRQMLAGNSAPFAYARWVRARADVLDPT